MHELSFNRTAPSPPAPLRGGTEVGGVGALTGLRLRVRAYSDTPQPNPPPQGGRAQLRIGGDNS